MAQVDFLAHLEDCVTTTEQCAASLSGGIRNLQPGVSDLPRLAHVLRNSHRFVVLPAPTVQAHKNLLSQALAPQIDGLISKAESSIQAQKDKITRLEERLSILEQSRIAAAPPAVSSGLEDEDQSVEDQLVDVNLEGLSLAQRRSVITLKGRRKRLEEERAALGV